MGPTEQSERASRSLGGQEVDQPTVLVDCADPPPGVAPGRIPHRTDVEGRDVWNPSLVRPPGGHVPHLDLHGAHLPLLSIEAIALAEKGLPRELT
jgi:hypothetical protein